MNILTFDIEEWYLNHIKNGPKEEYADYDRYLEAILDILDECQLTATFFCVGEMGRLFPEVIRKIQQRGHEIGCHSNTHTWLNKMSEEVCHFDTRFAIDSLEQCIGEKVKSYRAPAFSICESNKWAFEILAENGIEMDASIFPAARDFGGFPHFGQKSPCLIHYNGIQLKEFPISTIKVLGKEIAYSGGGYFRFFPLPFIKSQMKKSNYAMTYFHIGDFISNFKSVMTREEYESYFKEKGTLINRYRRFIKTNLGKKSAFDKMVSLISRLPALSIKEASKQIDWTKVTIIEF